MAEEEVTTRNVVFSNPDWQASTFSVDATGRRAALAVQKWIAVANLDHTETHNELKAYRKLAKQNKYEIKAVLWNPHVAKKQIIVSTCQQKLELWDVDAERYFVPQSIKAHTRPVCDMGWCSSDPNLLSSCSTDAFIHIWDIRETRKPKLSFKAVAGATLVAWNRLNGNIIASAHDSDIRIWDKRKASTASGYITAHMSRIHDLDWCYHSENQLTSCSHDGSVKFWNINSSREPFTTIKAGAQKLWRAKNYPAGNGVALLLVPTMHSGDSRVFLWGQSNVTTPVHIFSGHSEAVLDLQWISCEKLATWSKDRTLRLWGIGKQLKSSLGGDSVDLTMSQEESLSTEPAIDLSLEDSGTDSISQSGVGVAGLKQQDPSMSLPILKSSAAGGPGVLAASESGLGSSPSTRSLTSLSSFQQQQDSQTSCISPVFQSLGNHSLAQEFAQLRQENIPSVEIERLEVSQRNCTVKVVHGGQLVRVGITIPAHYPNKAAPSFMFHQSTTISVTSQQELNRAISDVANTHVWQNRPCLEPCLRCLVKTLESLANRPQAPKLSPDFDLFGRLDDEHIPFPRTSGARFSASGLLVCFNRPAGLGSGDSVKIPRSLDKMNTYKSRINPVIRSSAHWTSHTSFLSPSVGKRGSPAGGLVGSQGRSDSFLNSEALTSPVTVYNAISILPIDPVLARTYSVSGLDIGEVCSRNALVAAQHGRTDLVQAWSTAALIAEMGLRPPSTASTIPWPRHPFGRNLIKSLFRHFSELHDVQMLAMLACVFQQHYYKTLEMQKQQQSSQQTQLLSPAPHTNGAISPPTTSHSTSTAHPSPTYPHYAHTTPPLTPTLTPQAFHASIPGVMGVGGGSGTPTTVFPTTVRVNISPVKKIPQQQQQGSTHAPTHSPISSSWQNVHLESLEQQDQEEGELDYHHLQCRLLDPVMLRQCSEFHRSYADILYAWQLLDQRVEILKFQVMPTLDTVQQEIGFRNVCRECGDKVPGPSCGKKHAPSFAFTCSICNLSVKGGSNFCLQCGHGGHAQHMLDWFNKYSHCPSGCGCCCLEASGWT